MPSQTQSVQLMAISHDHVSQRLFVQGITCIHIQVLQRVHRVRLHPRFDYLRNYFLYQSFEFIEFYHSKDCKSPKFKNDL